MASVVVHVVQVVEKTRRRSGPVCPGLGHIVCLDGEGMLTSAWWTFHGLGDLWIVHDDVEERSPAMSAVGDELMSCVVRDCDELTTVFCQFLVAQTDDEENGIVVRDEMGVGEKMETGGGGDWNVMVQV
jgi:hypothetical protein